MNPIETLRSEKLERFYRNVGYYTVALAISGIAAFGAWLFIVALLIAFPDYNQ